MPCGFPNIRHLPEQMIEGRRGRRIRFPIPRVWNTGCTDPKWPLDEATTMKSKIPDEDEISQPADHLLDMPLESVEWEPHELLCLKAGHLRNVRDLVEKTEQQLLSIPGVGGGTLRAFKEFAERLGFKIERGRFFQSGGRKTDSFSMPLSEYSLIDLLIWRAWAIRQKMRGGQSYDYRSLYNKSEVLRAGLAALTRLSDEELHRAFEGLPQLRRGKPSIEEMQQLAELEELPVHRRAPQIDFILGRFDFNETHLAMKALNLRWKFSGKKRSRTPTPHELEEKAEELLELAIEDGTASGWGLMAIKRQGVLHLMFAPQYQAGTLNVRVRDESSG